jgi:hypothetical protein
MKNSHRLRYFAATKIEELLDHFLDIETLEELLERFDVSPYEAFEVLFDSGLIDEELINELLKKR